MGAFGVLIGLLIGFPMQWFSVRIIFVEETGYVFPVVIPWAAAAWVSAAALLAATLAGLGPAVHAARQPIAESIALE
jgi:putative ABC transport system permease protein